MESGVVGDRAEISNMDFIEKADMKHREVLWVGISAHMDPIGLSPDDAMRPDRGAFSNFDLAVELAARRLVHGFMDGQQERPPWASFRGGHCP